MIRGKPETLRELLLRRRFSSSSAFLSTARDRRSTRWSGIDRLREEVEGAPLHRADRVLDGPVGGHEDDRDVRIELARRVEDLVPVRAGELQVGHDREVTAALERLERRLAVHRSSTAYPSPRAWP
jgi:hypothetical protein